MNHTTKTLTKPLPSQLLYKTGAKFPTVLNVDHLTKNHLLCNNKELKLPVGILPDQFTLSCHSVTLIVRMVGVNYPQTKLYDPILEPGGVNKCTMVTVLEDVCSAKLCENFTPIHYRIANMTVVNGKCLGKLHVYNITTDYVSFYQR